MSISFSSDRVHLFLVTLPIDAIHPGSSECEGEEEGTSQEKEETLPEVGVYEIAVLSSFLGSIGNDRGITDVPPADLFGERVSHSGERILD